MRGREFLAFASSLSQDQSEASIRSIVSRAYYAAFLEARDYCWATGLTTPKRISSEHHDVPHALAPLDSQLAFHLKTLRTNRNTADYDIHLDPERMVRLAQFALRVAPTVIDRIDRLAGEAAESSKHTQQPDFAQDPDELFDVVNEDGSPTGTVKRRADVHRDGDWHRAIHVWVHGERDGEPFILFNLRSRKKDTWPLRLDVTVGGHLAAGEDTSQAYREIHEEIGIEAEPDRLQPVGRRKAIGQTERELQDVFLYRDDRPLAAYAPNPAELAGLVEVPVHTALLLFREQAASGAAILLDAVTHALQPFTIDERTLLPTRYFAYYRWIAESIDALHRGMSPASLAPPENDRERA